MTKQSPLISIITAGRNAEPYIEKCLNALRNQTLTNIEIICVDDASSDQTASIMQRFASQDPRFRVITNPKHQGVSAVRNQGLDAARGTYIMFCDTDDYYQPEMCERLYSFIQKTGAALVACEPNIIYHAHREMKPSDDFYYSLKYRGLQKISDDIVLHTDYSVQTKIFRRDLIEEYHVRFPEGLLYEDAYFCVAYFVVSSNIYFLPERLYNYVRHHKSTMSNTFSSSASEDTAIDHLRIAFALYDFFTKQKLFPRFNALFWQLFLSFEEFAINFAKSRRSRKLARTEAKAFITKHQSFFDQADVDTRSMIADLNSPRFLPSISWLKRLVLKFMPAFRLQINNVVRAQLVSTRQQQLIKELNSEIQAKWLK